MLCAGRSVISGPAGSGFRARHTQQESSVRRFDLGSRRTFVHAMLLEACNDCRELSCCLMRPAVYTSVAVRYRRAACSRRAMPRRPKTSISLATPSSRIHPGRSSFRYSALLSWCCTGYSVKTTRSSSEPPNVSFATKGNWSVLVI